MNIKFISLNEPTLYYLHILAIKDEIVIYQKSKRLE